MAIKIGFQLPWLKICIECEAHIIKDLDESRISDLDEDRQWFLCLLEIVEFLASSSWWQDEQEYAHYSVFIIAQ